MAGSDGDALLALSGLPCELLIDILGNLGMEDLCSCIFAFATEPSLKAIVAHVRDKQWLGKLRRPYPVVFMRSEIMARCLARTRKHLRHAATPEIYKLVSAKISPVAD